MSSVEATCKANLVYADLCLYWTIIKAHNIPLHYERNNDDDDDDDNDLQTPIEDSFHYVISLKNCIFIKQRFKSLNCVGVGASQV